jgi:hypothetical protein
MRRTIAFGLAASLLLATDAARAACHYEWVCDERGNCDHVPLCDNAIDVVPPEPPSVQPIPGPSVRPPETPTVPPVGARRCTQVRRQDAAGNWYWDTVCY